MAGVASDAARVLIVDDKADIRTIVATSLRVEPAFDVVGEAANGAEAIARAGELKPDLMVLDLQMPVMSGEEVIPILRSLAPELRVVVFSAYAGGRQRLLASERPDAEVRKGQGMVPLVRTLRRLAAEPPADLVRIDLGPLPVEQALRAGHAWARLNPSVRATAMECGGGADFLALVGVFLALGEPLRLAVRAGAPVTASVCFGTRLEAALAARRALATIAETDAALLEPIRSRLLLALPEPQPEGVPT